MLQLRASMDNYTEGRGSLMALAERADADTLGKFATRFRLLRNAYGGSSRLDLSAETPPDVLEVSNNGGTVYFSATDVVSFETAAVAVFEDIRQSEQSALLVDPSLRPSLNDDTLSELVLKTENLLNAWRHATGKRHSRELRPVLLGLGILAGLVYLIRSRPRSSTPAMLQGLQAVFGGNDAIEAAALGGAAGIAGVMFESMADESIVAPAAGGVGGAFITQRFANASDKRSNKEVAFIGSTGGLAGSVAAKIMVKKDGLRTGQIVARAVAGAVLGGAMGGLVGVALNERVGA